MSALGVIISAQTVGVDNSQLVYLLAVLLPVLQNTNSLPIHTHKL